MTAWKMPLVQAGLVLGLGFGGLADGIVLHQVLGWHHLICLSAHCRPASITQLQMQNQQDGLFHLALWLLMLGGTAMLFIATRAAGRLASGRDLFGAVLAGWGCFNFVEGVVDHHILGIHHVLPGHSYQLCFDLLFLAVGLVLICVGARLVRRPVRIDP